MIIIHQSNDIHVTELCDDYYKSVMIEVDFIAVSRDEQERQIRLDLPLLISMVLRKELKRSTLAYLC